MEGRCMTRHNFIVQFCFYALTTFTQFFFFFTDDEEESSAASSDSEQRCSSMSRSSSSPSDSDSEVSSPDEFPVASCKVCLVKPSQIVFLPCKHLCCCERCAARLHGKNCPICREQNLGYEKVYVI